MRKRQDTKHVQFPQGGNRGGQMPLGVVQWLNVLCNFLHHVLRLLGFVSNLVDFWEQFLQRSKVKDLISSLFLFFLSFFPCPSHEIPLRLTWIPFLASSSSRFPSSPALVWLLTTSRISVSSFRILILRRPNTLSMFTRDCSAKRKREKKGKKEENE